jgi:hypothetical protein
MSYPKYTSKGFTLALSPLAKGDHRGIEGAENMPKACFSCEHFLYPINVQDIKESLPAAGKPLVPPFEKKGDTF